MPLGVALGVGLGVALGVIRGVCRGVGRGVLRGVPMGVFLHDIIGVTESSIGQLHRDRITSLSFWSGSVAKATH